MKPRMASRAASRSSSMRTLTTARCRSPSASRPAVARSPPPATGGTRPCARARRGSAASRRRSRRPARCSSGRSRRCRSGSAPGPCRSSASAPCPGPSGQRQLDRLAVVLDPLAAQRHAHDLDVLARPLQLLAEAHAVPALGDLRAARAEAEQEAARRRGGRASPRSSRSSPAERPGIWKIAEPSRIVDVCAGQPARAPSRRRSRRPPPSTRSRSRAARPPARARAARSTVAPRPQ